MRAGRDIKVISYNIFSANCGYDRERVRQQIELLAAEDPDVVCLQEVWSPECHAAIVEAFPGYQAISAGASLRKDPPMVHCLASAVAGCACALFMLPIRCPNLPFMAALCLVMAAVSGRLLPAPAAVASVAPAALFGVSVGCRITASVFALLALLLQREVFRMVVTETGVAPVVSEIGFGDPLGLLTLVRLEHGCAGPTVSRTRYANQGALLEGSPWLLWAGWFEAAYLTRGAVSVDCDIRGVKLRVVNSHLANGVTNRNRQDQCEELADFAREGDADATVICCDANAHNTQPEIGWMRRQGFVDTFAAKWEDSAGRMRADAPHGGHTWDNSNPLVVGGNLVEPDQRIDYIWLDRWSTLETQQSKLVGDDPCLSDHYAVVTTFQPRLPRKPTKIDRQGVRRTRQGHKHTARTTVDNARIGVRH